MLMSVSCTTSTIYKYTDVFYISCSPHILARTNHRYTINKWTQLTFDRFQSLPYRPRLPVTTPYSPYVPLSQRQGHLFCQSPHLLHWLFVSQPQQQLIAIAITCAFVWEIPRDSLYINIHEGGARVVCVMLGKRGGGGGCPYRKKVVKLFIFKSQSSSA